MLLKVHCQSAQITSSAAIELGLPVSTAWVVSVAENGQGFDPKYAEIIFQPFKRLRVQTGVVVKLVWPPASVERLGSSIWAESTPGRGATFYFTLPDR